MTAHRPAVAPVTAPQPASGESYKPQLDGIRALCILFTVCNHISTHPDWINGNVGVDVFFALSGWLITHLLVREHENVGRVDLRAFYIRRVFRIVPLYLLTIASYVLLVSAGAKEGGSEELRRALPYALTFNMEYRPADAGYMFGHAWTLGIEEKFYLAWPLILAAALSVRRPLIGLLVGLAAVTTLLVSFGAFGLVIRGYAGLGFGAGLATLVTRAPELAESLKRWAIAGPLALVLALFYGLTLFDTDVTWPYLGLSATAAALIASLWFKPDQGVGKALAWGPLPWLGRLTYAVYLIQSIVIRLAEAVLARLHVQPDFWMLLCVSYALCVLCAWVAHICVEKPMIRLGKKLAEPSRPRRAVATQH